MFSYILIWHLQVTGGTSAERKDHQIHIIWFYVLSVWLGNSLCNVYSLSFWLFIPNWLSMKVPWWNKNVSKIFLKWRCSTRSTLMNGSIFIHIYNCSCWCLVFCVVIVTSCRLWCIPFPSIVSLPPRFLCPCSAPSGMLWLGGVRVCCCPGVFPLVCVEHPSILCWSFLMGGRFSLVS